MHKRRLIVFIFLLLFGAFALINSLNNPRLKELHGADLVQLIASGLCFGMALGVLVGGQATAKRRGWPPLAKKLSPADNVRGES